MGRDEPVTHVLNIYSDDLPTSGGSRREGFLNKGPLISLFWSARINETQPVLKYRNRRKGLSGPLRFPGVQILSLWKIHNKRVAHRSQDLLDGRARFMTFEVVIRGNSQFG